MESDAPNPAPTAQPTEEINNKVIAEMIATSVIHLVVGLDESLYNSFAGMVAAGAGMMRQAQNREDMSEEGKCEIQHLAFTTFITLAKAFAPSKSCSEAIVKRQQQTDPVISI